MIDLSGRPLVDSPLGRGQEERIFDLETCES